MHRNKIFDAETGFDIDRQLNQFLSVDKSKDVISKLVKDAVKTNIEKGNEYSRKRIADAELQIIKLKKEILAS
jgi:hypothetical protein